MAYSCADRVLAVLNGDIPDRVPIFEYLIHEGVFERLGYPNMAVNDSDAWLAACSKVLDLCHPTLYTPFEPGERINEDGSKTIIERWMTWEIPPPDEINTEEFMLRRIKKEIEELEKPGPSYDFQEKLREKKRRDAFTGDMVYLSYGCAPALPYDNTEKSIYFYSDHKELVEHCMKLNNRRTMEELQAIAYPELCPATIIWADIAYKDGLFYSPDLLERTFYPALTEMCDLFHSRGISVVYHADGDVTKALPQLAKCGIDGFNTFEICGAMDHAEFKEDYHGRMAMVGGMDAVKTLAFGTVDDVVAETKWLIDTVGKNGGLIAASSSGQIDDSMPTDNVMAFFETVWEYGRYI